jgi:hypothetical protein
VPDKAEPTKVTACTCSLLHIDWSGTAFTDGIGFTVIVKRLEVPEQLLETGVTRILAVMGILLPLVRVKLLTLPTPLAANPMDGLELVHWYSVPGTTEPVNNNAVDVPLQYVTLVLGFTLGTGFTKIEKVRGVPEQEFDIGVTVNKLMIGTLDPPVFVVKDKISPVPDKPDNPIILLFCVQL